MSWITVTWSMIAAVCLSFAAVHLLVWLRARAAPASLYFAISAGAAGVLTLLELAAMRASSPVEYAEMLRWMHVAAAVIVIGVVWFVRSYLQAGRAWLAWTIAGLRVLVLVPNFFGYSNATFSDITAIASFEFLGDTVSIPVGEPNPWRSLIHASSLLLIIFVVDAAAQAWRQGDRRHGLTIGGTIVAVTVLAAVFSQLMVRGQIPGPLVGLVFLLIVSAMGWELSLELIRAGTLSYRLRETQQRMDMAARAADLGLWDWDVVRDKVWMNDGARAQGGIDAAESVTFERYLRQVHPEDREATREAVLQALAGGDELRAEYRIAGLDGATRWIDAYGRVERNASGEPVQLRGVSMDVTARRRDEAELNKQRASLAQLQRASAMGQLSSALAHELSQPLGAILRNAEAAELFLQSDRPDLAELRAIVADIRRDDQRAAAVIDRMRSLLHRRTLQFETVSLRELVARVGVLMQGEFQARQAILSIEIPDGLPDVRGDRIHLEQVFLNLLLNSLEAVRDLPAERRQLVVEASGCGDGLVEVAVRDLGPGFPAEQMTSVFNTFVTTKSDGTGLGLAISKTIVEAHGGRVWAENDPRGGAIVRFTLQAARDGDPA
ncbi:MAG: PAS domain-containing protein [Burkholderiales bacterium]|nr:MAG: PAS domain-containing protein [Burkholderiales bacterium]